MKQTGYIAPEFKKTAFNCPFCGAYAQQNWTNDKVFLQRLFEYQHQFFLDYRKKILDHKQETIENFLRNIQPVFLSCSNRAYTFSDCQNCLKLSIWIDKKMIYPLISTAPIPCEDMPPKAKELYEEARQIATASPRAAAALLRCSLEELLKALGEKKGSLNTRIGNLVKQGLPSKFVQKALDIIRVFGNEAGSHVGTIDLSGKDNQETVYKLFNIMNFIVEKMITEPKTIDELTDRMPENKTEGIKNRDN